MQGPPACGHGPTLTNTYPSYGLNSTTACGYNWFGKAKGVNPDRQSRRGTTLISNPGGPSSLALLGYWPRRREL